MDNKTLQERLDEMDFRSTCKRFCDDINQRLDKVTASMADRAIWELFQNAGDVAKEDNDTGERKAYIHMCLTPTEFTFAHKGKPFTYDTLNSLVKQVSSQSKEDDEGATGQYGTGFVTTHSFGKVLSITGSMEKPFEPGQFIDVDDFEIDRSYSIIQDFYNKMPQQLARVKQLALNAPITSVAREWTVLKYNLSTAIGNNGLEKALIGFDSAVKTLPYLMTINPRIVEVDIDNQVEGTHIKFTSHQIEDENELKVMLITTEGNGVKDNKKVYFITSESGEDVIILPFDTPTTPRRLDGMAKLFVNYPLLGTENFGFEFIYHSNRFIPEEERNGLFLPKHGVNSPHKHENNVRVLNEMTDMLFATLKRLESTFKGWEEILNLNLDSPLGAEPLLALFYSDFKKKWVSFYENLKIFNVDNEIRSLAEGKVNLYSGKIIESLSDEGTDIINAVYDAAKEIGNIPSNDLIMKWSKVVSTWFPVDSKCFLTIKDLAKKISECDQNGRHADNGIIFGFDRFLSTQGLTSLFDEYTLIPNRDGKLMHKSELRDAQSIPDWVCELAVPFVPKDVEKFVDEEFVSIDKFSSYSRNDLRKAINAVLEDNAKETFRNISKPHRCDDSTLVSLAKLSLIVRDKSKETIRSRVMEVIAKHLEIPYELKELQALDSEEREFSLLPFKHLVENLFFEISTKDVNWMVCNSDYILDLHQSLSGWSEYYNRNDKKGIAMNYACFPNMLNQPSLAVELRNGNAIPEKLFELYNQVMGKDLRCSLVSPEFGGFCDFVSVDAQIIAKEIEDSLVEKNFEHDAVLDIIEGFDKTTGWKELFPRIAEKKADLFMKQVKKECKDGIFKLMKITDPDKLNQLAELANDVDFDEIIRKGKEALVERKNQERETEFKRNLGEYVERMIKKYLSDKVEDSDITVVTEFAGSDLSIRKNGTPVYYIEVKSRWGTDQSFQMTPTQMYESVEEAENYALCCVNMSFMEKGDADEHQYPEIEKVLPYMKFVTNIGEINKEIADVVYGSDSRKVYVEGDFKCVVRPSTVSEEGINFNSFIEIIAEKLK